MPASLPADQLSPILARLNASNSAYSRIYPGEPIGRQPVHTIYGGAHLFKRDSARRLGDLALASIRDYAPDFASFARAIHLRAHESLPETAAAAAAILDEFRRDPAAAARANPAAALAIDIYDRVTAKLAAEPVEDFRIDFEDGYGVRPEAEEDACAEQAAREVAAGMKENSLPPFIGIRIKNFGEGTAERGIRTLDIFLTTLASETRANDGLGKLPANFVLMLPKVVSAQQVTAMADLCDIFEGAGEKAAAPRFPKNSLKMEFMVETTQAVINADGVCPLPSFVRASRGRCIAAALGVYDYTASCGVTAHQQRIDHRACDFARHVMQVALGAAGVYLSDGATNIMPAPPHRAIDAAPLTPQQVTENRAAVHAAWRLNFEHVRRSLTHGWYQGWDLNPAQLPVRYAAIYSYFAEFLPEATARLRNFVDKAARATLAGGGVFDDAATAQGLLTFFIQGLRRRAITDAQAAATGLTPEEISTRSFVEILRRRSAK